jgi:hypothetical protein
VEVGDDAWFFGGPRLTIPFRREVNGYVMVDSVDRPWPDHMGDPKKAPLIFGAWSMGHFGPFAYPGGLARAGQHSWNWQLGKTIAQGHSAFLRVRSTYVFRAKDDAPLMPEDYDPLPELEFLTRIAADLLALPQAVCYFNPNGEVLRDADALRESLNAAWWRQLPPLDAWANIRLFRSDEDWCFMDTVGNGQLDLPDLEACFRDGV